MTARRRTPCPEYLCSAWDWIDCAGEWDAALADPAAYAAAAAANAAAHDVIDVTEFDLYLVIEWERAQLAEVRS